MGLNGTFDVVIVGARCAGSPLATLLARQGLKVAVVERATFPKDTLSTHIFQGPSIKFLRRLGVLDQVYATGARPVNRIDGRWEDLRYVMDGEPRPGDEGGAMSVRRLVLDPLLAGAAGDAGAEVMMATNVTGLIREDGRVAGVSVSTRGGTRELRARLVVGADGRHSTVAKLAGARKYNVTSGERFGYWGFFEGADPGPDPAMIYHRWEGRFVVATPSDGGLYQVLLIPDLRFLPDFKADREAAFASHVAACEPAAAAIAGARRVGKLQGLLRYDCYFRESAGPGWALVGDAGHFKDPAPGQGMSDAFRQSQALAAVIGRTIGESDAGLDAAMRSWARWRDRDAAEHYWLGTDFGAAGNAPSLVVEMMRRMHAKGELGDVFDVLQHRALPSKVFSPGRLMVAAAGRAGTPGVEARAVLGELKNLLVTDVQRRRLALRPEMAEPETAPSGPVGVADRELTDVVA